MGCGIPRGSNLAAGTTRQPTARPSVPARVSECLWVGGWVDGRAWGKKKCPVLLWCDGGGRGRAPKFDIEKRTESSEQTNFIYVLYVAG